MSDRNYKRSWRNLLINKRYQLRFTLFMVGLCALLMTGLGVWVMKVANETTQVAKNRVGSTPFPEYGLVAPEHRVPGTQCPDVTLYAPDQLVPSDGADGDASDTPMTLPDPQTAAPTPTDTPAAPAATASADPAPATASAPPAPSPAASGSAGPAAKAGTTAGTPAPTAGAGSGAGSSAAPTSDEDDEAAARRRRSRIQVHSEMEPPKVSPEFGASVVKKWTCLVRLSAAVDHLEKGRMRILYVLFGVGVLLVVFLAGYGIKMTHKVAGPLFKVGLYHAKMKQGRFDKVYNLRKGDQLVEFYEHFKNGHAGIVKAEQDDLKQLKAVVAAAEAAGAGEHAAVAELRELIAKKEKSLA